MKNGEEESPNRQALMDIMRDIEDPEAIKGFFVTHASVFMIDENHVNLFGLIMEVLYDIGGKEVKRCIERVLKQQDVGVDIEDTPAAEYAKKCALRYSAIFQ